jgi:hypothetical protein
MKTQATPTTATVSGPKRPMTTIRDKSSKVTIRAKSPKTTASALEISKATASPLESSNATASAPDQFFFECFQRGRCNKVFQFTTNPVCERRVNLLVCSLPLHRHSYIGFILDFASSIHNKQQVDNLVATKCM